MFGVNFKKLSFTYLDRFSGLIRFSCLAFLIMFTEMSYSSGSEVSAEAEDKTSLHFVTFIDPPYVFDNTRTQQTGLIDIILKLKQLMTRVGMQYTIQTLPAKRAEIVARTTQNTCILPIEKSQEREVLFSWVSPIIMSKHGFFSLPSRDEIHLVTLSDALPYRIGSYLGSGIGDYLNSFEYRVDFAAQNNANIQKLNMQRIDLWASDILSAEHISKTTGIQISASKLNFFTTLRAIGCHLGTNKKIISTMQKTLQDMYREGSIYNIIQKFKADNFNTSAVNSSTVNKSKVSTSKFNIPKQLPSNQSPLLNTPQNQHQLAP